MILLVLPVCIGAAVGWLRSGHARGLADLRWRAPALVVVAAGMQLLLHRVPSHARVSVVLVSYVTVGAWVAINVRGRRPTLRAAFLLVGAGWAMNLAAMVPNGGMPVSGEALTNIGAGSAFDVDHGHLYKHVPADRSTALAWLGDVIPVAPLGAVVSPGDVVMATGIVLLVSSAMADAAPRARRRDEIAALLVPPH